MAELFVTGRLGCPWHLLLPGAVCAVQLDVFEVYSLCALLCACASAEKTLQSSIIGDFCPKFPSAAVPAKSDPLDESAEKERNSVAEVLEGNVLKRSSS